MLLIEEYKPFHSAKWYSRVSHRLAREYSLPQFRIQLQEFPSSMYQSCSKTPAQSRHYKWMYWYPMIPGLYRYRCEPKKESRDKRPYSSTSSEVKSRGDSNWSMLRAFRYDHHFPLAPKVRKHSPNKAHPEMYQPHRYSNHTPSPDGQSMKFPPTKMHPFQKKKIPVQDGFTERTD